MEKFKAGGFVDSKYLDNIVEMQNPPPYILNKEQIIIMEYAIKNVEKLTNNKK